MTLIIPLAVALYVLLLIWAVRKLDKWAARPKLIQLTRFPGNEEALKRWQHRYEHGGYTVRPVRTKPNE